jgi:hypothetical protein
MSETDRSKFSLSYFFFGEGIKDWWKSWGFGWRLIVTILVILFIVTAVQRVFFSKNQTQTQKLVIMPFSFSTVTYAPQQEQKQEIKKRPWWLPYVFGELYAFGETAGVDNSRTGIGTRGGLRWEW